MTSVPADSALPKVMADVHEHLAIRQDLVPLDALKDLAGQRSPARACAQALRVDGDGTGVRIIAEVKRSSPRKQALTMVADLAGLASECEAGGACVVSVQTQRALFGGSPSDVGCVRAAVDIPVMSRDFVVSSYQVWEARSQGADLIYLTACLLDASALTGLIERSHSLGMTTLVECATVDEIELAVHSGAAGVCVNARNIHTLDVDRDLFARLRPAIPQHVVAVAASGVRGPHDIISYARAGADAIIAGEALVTGQDPKRAVADLVAAGSHPALRGRW